MSDTVRVYVNATGIDVPAGASVLDAVRAWNEAEGAAVEQGTRAITDSRGLPVVTDHPVYAGAIFRLVSNRGAADASSASQRVAHDGALENIPEADDAK